jgi:hypothetical protein
MNSSDIVEHFLKVLNEDNIRKELNCVYQPVINKVTDKVMPYIYLALIFILINFILLILIFALLFQIKLPKISNLFYKLKS